jgi:hypothetical protein
MRPSTLVPTSEMLTRGASGFFLPNIRFISTPAQQHGQRVESSSSCSANAERQSSSV